MATELAGTVQSGGNTTVLPLEGVPVTLYQAAGGASTVIGSTTSGPHGKFSIRIGDGGAGGDGIFYAVAQVRERVVMMAVVGPEIRGQIVINELTTVAAAFSMAQFADGTSLSGNTFGLRTAAMMNDNLVDPLSGAPSPVLLAPPNADQTNALRSTRSLANMVAACARATQGAEAMFLKLATAPGAPPPGDTFQALLNVARNPASNPGALFNLSQGVPTVYSPPLFSAPDAWTLAVKFNDSGDDAFMFGGPANIAFDRNGYAWIANNVFQGTPNSGDFIIVLRPDGRPADGSSGTVRSPVFGGGLKGPGWGIGIDPDGHVWVGNFGWGVKEENPRHGSVSEFAPDGTPLSPEHGYQNETHRVQATVPDADGNIWMASYGNGRLVVYRGGDPENALHAHSGKEPFGIAIGRDGDVWVSNSNGLGWPEVKEGSVTRFRLEDGRLEKTLPDVPVGAALKVIALDSLGHAWVASAGDDRVYRISPSGDVSPGYGGGGIEAPWGLAIDGDDNVWVANFGRLGLDSNYIRAGLSVLAGDTEKNRRAGLGTGDPISPPTGYTLPSAGEPVRMHNGQPLYTDGTECYSPLLRSTSCQIDAAGNVWWVNNWKPRFASDFDPSEGDPGGDGVVIFVGLARAPRPPAWLDPSA